MSGSEKVVSLTSRTSLAGGMEAARAEFAKALDRLRTNCVTGGAEAAEAARLYREEALRFLGRGIAFDSVVDEIASELTQVVEYLAEQTQLHEVLAGTKTLDEIPGHLRQQAIDLYKSKLSEAGLPIPAGL